MLGNLTRDPELRYTPGGAPVTGFGLGINRRFRDSAGAPKEEVTFVEVVAWGKQAELSSEYLAKGRLVLVEGRLRQERWEGPKGEARSALKVVAERIQFLPNGRPPAAAEEPEGEGAGAPEGDVPF